MEKNETEATRKRRRHLRVPVFPEEATVIEENAKRAGLSVARYLREVGQGYQVKGIMDYQYVRELVRVNGDLGRLGGLLKLWLSDDIRTAGFTKATILALLSKIESLQDEMTRLMWSIVKPGTKP
ncbi:conjugal transfer transcriptional regulator TraJ [Bordetella genomosp. 4]|uniref:conjugal transfer transcriptional regulator TraJ n=1 Tax=Bordetella genomosp. 4 TaxID=463044 RepID=UPI000B9DF690|nr:conjugal transfer transcriptional regulator TraJ [Bordetella genomosp. 4]OZI49408.1 conjugal transfer protein TraJ [Bordetella genomosp. 4]